MARPKGCAKPAGSGKQKGYKAPATLAKEAARELVRQAITRELEPLVKAQVANAKGLSYLVTRDKRTGKFIRVGAAMARRSSTEETIEVWEKDPCVQAFTDLLNRAIDKPIEHLDANVTAVLDWEKKAAYLASARQRRGLPAAPMRGQLGPGEPMVARAEPQIGAGTARFTRSCRRRR